MENKYIYTATTCGKLYCFHAILIIEIEIYKTIQIMKNSNESIFTRPDCVHCDIACENIFNF